jgi:hypothetical protein
VNQENNFNKNDELSSLRCLADKKSLSMLFSMSTFLTTNKAKFILSQENEKQWKSTSFHALA